MGKDIHWAFEERIDGKWVPLDNIKIDKLGDGILRNRYYDFFNWIDNNFHAGLPDELQNIQLYFDDEFKEYDWDTTEDWMFGHRYLTLEEFENLVDKEWSDISLGNWVGQRFLDRFFELGGEMPEGLIDRGDHIVIIDDDEMRLKEHLLEILFLLRELSDKLNVTWEDRDFLDPEDEDFPGIPRYNNFRIVCAFDN